MRTATRSALRQRPRSGAEISFDGEVSGVSCECPSASDIVWRCDEGPPMGMLAAHLHTVGLSARSRWQLIRQCYRALVEGERGRPWGRRPNQRCKSLPVPSIVRLVLSVDGHLRYPSEQEIAGLELRLGDAIDRQNVDAVKRDHAVAAGIGHEGLQRGKGEPKAVEIDHVGPAGAMAGEAGDRILGITWVKYKGVAH